MNMENKKYKYEILWIDDDISLDSDIDLAAETRNMDLRSVKDYSTGWKSLKEGHNYDAVILDVYCKEKEDEAPSFEVFKKYLKYICDFCEDNTIPWFVYTGGIAGAKENSNMIEVLIQAMRSNSKFHDIRDYYNKPTDFEIMLDDIINFVDNRRETHLKNKYKDILSIFKDYPVEKKHLLLAIKHIEGDTFLSDAYLNLFRQLLESLREYLYEKGFLPKQLTSGIAINSAKSFFTSVEMRYTKDNNPEGLVPSYIQKAFYYITDVTQEGSHNLPVSEDLALNRTPYLYNSIFETLFTFLYWLTIQDDSPEAIKTRRDYVNSLYDRISTTNKDKTFDINNEQNGIKVRRKAELSEIIKTEQRIASDQTYTGIYQEINETVFIPGCDYKYKVRSKKTDLYDGSNVEFELGSEPKSNNPNRTYYYAKNVRLK